MLALCILASSGSPGRRPVCAKRMGKDYLTLRRNLRLHSKIVLAHFALCGDAGGMARLHGANWKIRRHFSRENRVARHSVRK
jgi:hypothetical protein